MDNNKKLKNPILNQLNDIENFEIDYMKKILDHYYCKIFN